MSNTNKKILKSVSAKRLSLSRSHRKKSPVTHPNLSQEIQSLQTYLDSISESFKEFILHKTPSLNLPKVPKLFYLDDLSAACKNLRRSLPQSRERLKPTKDHLQSSSPKQKLLGPKPEDHKHEIDMITHKVSLCLEETKTFDFKPKNKENSLVGNVENMIDLTKHLSQNTDSFLKVIAELVFKVKVLKYKKAHYSRFFRNLSKVLSEEKTSIKKIAGNSRPVSCKSKLRSVFKAVYAVFVMKSNCKGKVNYNLAGVRLGAGVSQGILSGLNVKDSISHCEFWKPLV